MGDPAESLHEDTKAWLEARNAWRDELAAAVTGGGDGGDDDQEAEDQTEEEAAEEEVADAADEAAAENGEQEEEEEDPNDSKNTGTEADDCEVPGREEGQDPGDEPCTNLADNLADVTPLVCIGSDPNGWPNCDQLYSDINAMLKRAKTGPLPTDTQAQLIRLQRQANAMESYRKMLLHRKQKACHYLESWCQCLREESRLQGELQSLLSFQPIGLQASPSVAEQAEAAAAAAAAAADQAAEDAADAAT